MIQRVLPALLVLLSLLHGEDAAARTPPAISPDTGPVTLSLVARDSGLPLAQARHRGQTWVGGWPGQAYAVRLHNRGPERVLVVLSVDGVNAISGQTADPRQAGYVLEPGQLADITGWRKSMQTVAGFVFVDPRDSYATRTGRPDNVGVVGIAVHRERTPHRWPSPAPAVAGAAESAAVGDRVARAARSGRQAIGTGHGDVTGSPTWSTVFQRDPRPIQLTELRYDTPDALRARGVPLAGPRITRHADHPRAFPGGFVPNPPAR
ncbi:hypothetical protein [Xanthomonas sp. XNM01]|uniref:hypothetical protein n=1 Tax=Xanthomonas sp. XNM01 TaxID=2769289 RepID=UPI001CE1E00B|nr:hypothetical protein [Xanthomonas sp. XNM01]